MVPGPPWAPWPGRQQYYPPDRILILAAAGVYCAALYIDCDRTHFRYCLCLIIKIHTARHL